MRFLLAASLAVVALLPTAASATGRCELKNGDEITTVAGQTIYEPIIVC